MESWRRVFRDGFAPILPTEGLEYVAELLRNDSEALIQRELTYPPDIKGNAQDDVEAACFIGACGMGAGLRTVDEVGDFFGRACWDTDKRLGKSADCRHFLNWFDETPRGEMRRKLLPEVERVLGERKAVTV